MKIGQQALSYDQRTNLVELSIEAYPWISQDIFEGSCIPRLQTKWPSLNFIHFYMNGADDVLKYGKWMCASADQRFITMGRPGYTEELNEELVRSGIDLDAGNFILGPELEDVSSTAVREAIMSRNMSSLGNLLDKRVAEWCLANYRI